jgi:hypothetical protein
MLKIKDLELGSNDAEDYKRKELKDFFNTVFVKNIYLDKLLDMNTFFLIGEKGTGKTAYSIFLANNEFKNTRSMIKYIRETQYQKFITLKNEKQLFLSEYASIWRVIILVLLASNIKKDNITNRFSKNGYLEKINKAIDDYFNNAFSPEIATAMQIVENSNEVAGLVFNVLNYKGENSVQLTFSETKFQINLQYLERNLLKAIMDLKLEYNQFLFIDGIDIRPSGIAYKEYFSPLSVVYHYLHMASGNYRQYLQTDEIKIKKYFYVLRPIMACMWIEKYKESPPMEFEKLLVQISDKELLDKINELLLKKNQE